MSVANQRTNPLIKSAAELERDLSLRFHDSTLLERALRHRSAGRNNNERLEFLGDSIVNAVVADYLFRNKPDAPEGALSRLRASVVREEGLSKVARRIRLGDYIEMGAGELKSGGHRRDSILADALEAVIGALYLDQGFDVAADWIRDQFAEELECLPDAQSLKDAKTQLQEFLQRDRRALPVYEVVDQFGQAHNQTFRVRCSVALDTDQACQTQADGTSRRKAEQSAARAMLDKLTQS